MPYEITQNKQRVLPPAGNHVARLVWFIDLGNQDIEWKGEVKNLHKVRMSWELPTEVHVFDEHKGAEPFMVHKEYTLSFNDKATLRKDLESWRGKAFTEEELKVFDETKLMGKPCMVNVVHTTKGEKTYANVTGITNIPKGMQDYPQYNDSMIYNAFNGEDEIFKGLPEWLQEKIAKSPQFKAGVQKQQKEKVEESWKDTEEKSPVPSEDDEIPF